eukprot:gene7147-6990_t
MTQATRLSARTPLSRRTLLVASAAAAWNPVLAPAGIAADTRTQLVAAIRKALADPEVLGRIRALGGDVFADPTQASAGKFIQAQQAQWGKVIRERKIVLQAPQTSSPALSGDAGWDCHVHVFDASAPVQGGHYLPAHQPLERFPAIIKAAAQEVGAAAQYAGG